MLLASLLLNVMQGWIPLLLDINEGLNSSGSNSSSSSNFTFIFYCHYNYTGTVYPVRYTVSWKSFCHATETNFHLLPSRQAKILQLCIITCLKVTPRNLHHVSLLLNAISFFSFKKYWVSYLWDQLELNWDSTSSSCTRALRKIL
jgi:hypothetical protein